MAGEADRTADREDRRNAPDERSVPDRPTSRRARGALTHRKLLVAAEEAFSAKGYHATRVDDIVKAARISHGTFYLYFANKEAVFGALTETVAAELAAVGEGLPSLEPGTEGAAALEAWFGEVSEVFARHGAVIRAWAESETAANDDRDPSDDVLAVFTATLAARIAEIDPPDPDPEAAAVAIVAMIERTHLSLLAGRADLDRHRVVSALARLVHSALFPVR